MAGTLLLGVLLVLFVGSIPTWPHSRGWGFYPSSVLGVLLVVVFVLLQIGRV